MGLVTGSGRSQWATPLQLFALEIAGVFLAGALAYSALMPRTRDLAGPAPATVHRVVGVVLRLLLAALAVWTVMQVPALGSWWASDRVLLVEATGTGQDPMGLRIIPQIMLLSLPTLAAIVLVTFLLTSLAGMFVRTDLAFRVLAACTALAGGNGLWRAPSVARAARPRQHRAVLHESGIRCHGRRAGVGLAGTARCASRGRQLAHHLAALRLCSDCRHRRGWPANARAAG